MNVFSCRLSLLFTGLIFLFLSMHIAALREKWHTNQICDFAIVYESAQAMAREQTPYTIFPVDHYKDHKKIAAHHSTHTSINLNPPFVNKMSQVLSHVTYVKGWQYFTGISLACLFLGVFLLPPLQVSRSPILFFLSVVLILLAYFPTYINTQYGQWGLVLFFFISWAWRCLEKEYFIGCGVLLGLASAIKLFLLLFLVYFFLARLYEALIAMIFSFLFFSLLPGLECGLSIFKEYAYVLSQIHWYGANWNVSLFGMLSRIGLMPTLVVSMIFCLIISFILYLSVLGRKPSTFQKSLGFHLSLVLSLCFSPLGWLYYFPILILPGLFLFQAWHDLKPVWPGLLLIGALFLSALPSFYKGASEIKNAGSNLWCYGFGFYALLILIALIVYTARSKPVLSFQEQFVISNTGAWFWGIVFALLPGSLWIIYLGWVSWHGF